MNVNLEPSPHVIKIFKLENGVILPQGYRNYFNGKSFIPPGDRDYYDAVKVFLQSIGEGKRGSIIDEILAKRAVYSNNEDKNNDSVEKIKNISEKNLN